MRWKLPPQIKILEALGAAADGRVQAMPTGAKVRSSSGGKTYDVAYDAESNCVMSNDNAAYWQGTLGYPAIAFFLVQGIIPHNEKFSRALKGVKWKDINVQFKNDFSKTESFVKESLKENGLDIKELEAEILRIETCLHKLNPGMLGPKKKPPQGY